MGRTDGKNGSFMAIRMRIHQNFSSSMIPAGICKIRVLDVFIISSDFNLTQHFSCSVKSVECGQIFFLACQQLQKKVQHNFITPLSPHDALNHHFTSLKTNLIFPQQRVLERKFPWNLFTTSNHLHLLQVKNCDSNSRLVVDEDDNGKFRPERVKQF